MRISELMKQQWTNSSVSTTNMFTVAAENSGDNSLVSQVTQSSGGVTTNNMSDLFSLCATYRSDATSDSYDSSYSTTDSSFKVNAQAALKNRDSLNTEIQSVLSAAGIKLDSATKLTFTVGADSSISVSGAKDAATKAKIEAALNSKTGLGATMIKQNVVVKLLNNQDVSQLQYDKWEVANFLQEKAGQDISDLSLVNGQLTGANEKLTALIDSADKSGSSSAKTVQEMIASLKKVLSYGQDKIPDMSVSYGYQRGALIDKNVQYGFGPNQLKSWYAQVMSGSSSSSSSSNYWV
ncbi:MAG TPA: DUF4885 family protein [Patescibacteria group bacterium]|nr:DUF4885 family protein [Patescibacteria group bacterium]